MSKLISVSIDVLKIPKPRLIAGKNGGLYLNLDININDEPDQYGNDCSCSIRQTKEEREAKEKRIYLGNGKKLFGFSKTDQAKGDVHPQGQTEDCQDIPF